MLVLTANIDQQFRIINTQAKDEMVIRTTIYKDRTGNVKVKLSFDGPKHIEVNREPRTYAPPKASP